MQLIEILPTHLLSKIDCIEAVVAKNSFFVKTPTTSFPLPSTNTSNPVP